MHEKIFQISCWHKYMRTDNYTFDIFRGQLTEGLIVHWEGTPSTILEFTYIYFFFYFLHPFFAENVINLLFSLQLFLWLILTTASMSYMHPFYLFFLTNYDGTVKKKVLTDSNRADRCQIILVRAYISSFKADKAWIFEHPVWKKMN